jgi:hypothetical protein
LVAESVKVNVAVRAAAAAGLNVKVTVQLADADKLDPQVLADIAKSPESAPDKAMLLIVMAALLPLLRVADCDVLLEPTLIEPNERVVGLTLTVPAEAVAVPDKATLCVLTASTKLNVADSEPLVFGAKTIFAVQLVFAAKLVPQVLL